MFSPCTLLQHINKILSTIAIIGHISWHHPQHTQRHQSKNQKPLYLLLDTKAKMFIDIVGQQKAHNKQIIQRPRPKSTFIQ